MRSSEHPDIPEGWTETHDGVRFYLSSAGLLTFAVIAFLVGIIAAAAGNFVGLGCCLLFALLMVLAVAYSAVVRHRRADLSTATRTVEQNGIPATEIQYSGWQFTILIALMGCAAAFCAIAAAVFFHQIASRSVLFAVLGLLSVSFMAPVVSGRVRRGGVTLSSQGIFQRGRSFESRLDWSAVAGAKAATNGHPYILVFGYANVDWHRRYTTRFWRIDRLPPVPMIAFDCRQFDVDPYVLYSYVRTYVDNPELRAELGTEAALSRARYLQPGR
ncbi:hypothetical protein FR943_16450 [Mycobacterium sp. TNTM28]|uniref:Integral membrane protein n=1 Tax=[Mycobacterium] fortunisiensis TaxID=2600579 RepID=A0ABS6KP94_9MYCO|nr:hypothetical protein [[Mycobacterium] fortunisiensis]MBU9765431.1 hypothetical protein [[Mycobacterium] fortunisiensis]